MLALWASREASDDAFGMIHGAVCRAAAWVGGFEADRGAAMWTVAGGVGLVSVGHGGSSLVVVWLYYGRWLGVFQNCHHECVGVVSGSNLAVVLRLAARALRR